MSLIPFILDLADELHEFSRCLASGIDINDFGFGLYTGTNDQQQQQPTGPQQQQQQQSSSQQQSPRRSRTSSFSSTFWMPTKRHHPYNRIKSACCGKPLGDEGGAVSIGVGISGAVGGEKDVSATGTPGKAASYSVVNKNGFQVSMNVKQFSPNELSVKTIDNCIVVEGRHDDKEDGHGVISRHFVRKYMLPKGYDPKDVLSTLSSDGILTVKAPPPPPPIAKNDERTERIVEIQPAPGPAQTVPVVVSAKEAPLKEHTKKLLSPTARAECQLPEKRQKLDLPQEQEQEATEAQTPPSPPPQTPSSESSVAAAAPDDAAAAANDEENEKVEEQTAESDNKQAQEKPDSADVTTTPADDDDVEGDDGKEEDAKKEDAKEEEAKEEEAKQDVADQADDDGDKQLKQKEAMEIDETDKTTEDKLPETNGDTNAASNESSSEANEPVAESCKTSTTKKTTDDDEVPAENAKEKDEVKENDCKADNDSKMEVDEVEENVSISNKTETADVEKTPKSKAEDKEKKGENNTTENTNNNTNSKSTTQNDKGKKDEEEDDNTPAGKVPADSAKSAATTKAAESVTDGGDIDKKETTAVSPPEAKNDIDDVALLKKAAVTADATEITAAEENALLSEPMDGIATSDSPSVADKVECSLFAKSHLGNGNSATLVATEEVAN